MSEQGHRYLAPGAGHGAQRLEAPGDGHGAQRLEAPGGGAQHLEAPGAERPFPRVSDHVVDPDAGQEMYDGVIVEVQPAKPPHARAQAMLATLIGTSVTRGYGVDAELLTRTSWTWNFASDVCIRKNGIDPESDCRYLEEVVFEVNHKQSERLLRGKAEQMANRGVRRVFVIDVTGSPQGAHSRVTRVREWLGGETRWRELGADEVIDDPCLVQPVPVAALLDPALFDATGPIEDVTARAILAKAPPVIRAARAKDFEDGRKQGFEQGERKGFEQGEREGFEQGEREGFEQGERDGEARAMRRAIRTLLALRGLELTGEHEVRLEACRDIQVLDGWLQRAVTEARVDDMLV